MNTSIHLLIRKILRLCLVFGILSLLCSGLIHSPVAHAQEPAAPGARPAIPNASKSTGSGILLVDDDDNNPDVRSYYTAPLDALGKSYDIVDTGGGNNDPSAATLAGYAIVIWFTGANYGDTVGPSSAGATALSSWLNAGGCFFMSSQDYYNPDQGLPAFAGTYLGASSVTDGVGQTSITGAGNVFGGIGSYSLSFPVDLYNYSDRITPTASAETAFTGSSGSAAVDKDNGVYRTTYLGFPFEAIPNLANRQQLISTFLGWCGSIQTLTIAKSGPGTGRVTSTPAGIDCGSDCSYDFNSNAQVTLTAEPDSPYVFGGWSGACNGMEDCVVQMNAAKSVTATFNLTTLTVYLVNVSTTDEHGLAAGRGISTQKAVGDVGITSIKTHFYPGDPIQLRINVDNQTSTTQYPVFQWIVLNQSGYDVLTLESIQSLPTDPGLQTWYLDAIVPFNAPAGAYTFYGFVTYTDATHPDGLETSASTIFHVDLPPSGYKLYLPVVVH